MWSLFVHAGWVAWPLGACSVIALAVVLERIYTLSRLRRLEDRAFMMLQLALENQDDAMLRDRQIAGAPVTVVMNTLAPLRGASEESIERTAEVAVAIQRMRLRRYLSSLATIGSTAPFIGLFGTVIGVMAAFQAIGNSGLSGESIAAGISEALSATALGLLVAIPSVIAYNILLNRVQAQMLGVHSHVARLLPLLQTADGVKGDGVKQRQEA